MRYRLRQFITGKNKHSTKRGSHSAPSAKKIVSYTPTAQEFKALATQKSQLKTLLGEKDLEIAILRDLFKKAPPTSQSIPF
jgi:hypothetical protein